MRSVYNLREFPIFFPEGTSQVLTLSLKCFPGTPLFQQNGFFSEEEGCTGNPDGKSFTGVEGESHENHRQEEPVRKAVDHAPVIADFKEDTDHETWIGDGTVEPETQWRPERIRERKHKTVRIVCFYDDNSFDEYYPANE